MEPDEPDNRTGEAAASSDAAGAATGPPAHAKPRTISRRRLVWVDVLITFTTVLLVIGMLSIYANRLLFNPTNWSNTSTQLLQNENVRSSAANYLVDQLYANVNVARLIKGELPPQLQSLAGPASGALRNVAVQATETALTRPRIQNLWRKANYAANQVFIKIVSGGGNRVKVDNGVVTLNLSAIIGQVATRLGLPASVVAKIPPNIGNLTVLKSNQLKSVQNIGDVIKGLALWLNILVPILYAMAILLAKGHRRRTLMTVGSAAVFAGLLVFFARRLLIEQIPSSLSQDASTQATIKDVVSISTGLLYSVAGAVTFVGAIIALCAWFAGPARPFVVTRRAMAPFLREQPFGAYAISLAIMGLLFLWDPIPATGTPAGIITFLVLALFGTEVLRRQTAREFPDARPGDATRAMRARWTRIRDRRATDGRSPGDPSDTANQLLQLSDLRDKGALTPEEYQSAKSKLLHS